VSFNKDTNSVELAEKISRNWFEKKQYERAVPLDEKAFLENTDQGCTRSLCHFFDSLIEKR